MLTEMGDQRGGVVAEGDDGRLGVTLIVGQRLDEVLCEDFRKVQLVGVW